MNPKKSLGQNFLTSVPARIAIVKAGNVTKKDTVLEIGPGGGFLTEELLKTGATIIAVEKDRELISVLNQRFKTEISQGQLKLVEGDALKFNPSFSPLATISYKLVANIPYYITGAILEKYLSSKIPPSQMVVLVQKEVAERIVARDKKESVLSLSVKVYGEPSIVYRVNKGSFNPIPSVDSAVLSIENISRAKFHQLGCPTPKLGSEGNVGNRKYEEIFFKLVKSGFSHKRKFLISNLKINFPKINFLPIFIETEIDEKVRAEDVPLSLWLEISQKIMASSF